MSPDPSLPGRFDTVVIGAGMTGLCAAHHLARQGRRVAVLEAADRPGGVIGSVRRDGCLFERGPNSAMDTTPLIGELVDTLGLRDQLRWASEASNKRYVRRDGRLLPLPMSPAAFFSTPLFSLGAKLALMGEPFRPPGDPQVEESIAAFVRRRLGHEFLDYAIDPFVAGIYAGDPERISVQAAFPKLHALEQRWGSLIKGQFLGARERKKRGEVAKNAARSFSFAGGMQVLTDALAADVSGRGGLVLLGTQVLRLARDDAADGGADGGADTGFVLQARRAADGSTVTLRARTVLLATSAPAMAEVLRPLVPDAAAALAAIEYAPVATVASAYTASGVGHPLDGFGALMPRREGRRVLGVLFSSTMFDGRAPAGQALLTTFIGGKRHPQLPGQPPADIAAVAHEEHAALLDAREAPIFQEVTRWPQAIPQYNLGHLARVQQAETAEQALPGLFLGGSWKGGVAVGDCLRNGLDLGGRIAARLA